MDSAPARQNTVGMPSTAMRCERCGGSLAGRQVRTESRIARLCSTCRAEAARSLERAQVAEEEGLALTELVTADIDVAMLKEGR
jgi:NMD protein affecting ribosome stability and mRNA decay